MQEKPCCKEILQSLKLVRISHSADAICLQKNNLLQSDSTNAFMHMR
jgi:hypothetical protein